MALARDPVSVLFDAGARRLLARAYAARGGWVATRLADPSPRHLAYLARRGIAWDGPGEGSSQGGSGKRVPTRWARGFHRALYYQHKWYSSTSRGFPWRGEKRAAARTAGALEVEWGRRVRAVGVLPGGVAVRVRIRAGGKQKLAAVQRLPDSRRIYTDDGRAAARWSDPARRDW